MAGTELLNAIQEPLNGSCSSDRIIDGMIDFYEAYHNKKAKIEAMNGTAITGNQDFLVSALVVLREWAEELHAEVIECRSTKGGWGSNGQDQDQAKAIYTKTTTEFDTLLSQRWKIAHNQVQLESIQDAPLPALAEPPAALTRLALTAMVTNGTAT